MTDFCLRTKFSSKKTDVLMYSITMDQKNVTGKFFPMKQEEQGVALNDL